MWPRVPALTEASGEGGEPEQKCRNHCTLQPGAISELLQ